MEKTPGFYLFLNTICILLCRLHVKGRACLPTHSPVLSMCQSGQITGKQVYLDTSDFTGLSVTCTCRLEPKDAGGAVTFDPVVVDKTNCLASILMHEYRFVHDCSSNGDRIGYLPAGASIDFTVLGQGRVESCVKLYTDDPAMTLNVTCHEPARVTSTTLSTTTSATTPSLTTGISSTRETTSVQARTCSSSTIPGLKMCESQAMQSWRISIDSSLFSEQYSSCTCTVRMVTVSGGSVSVYPDVVDHYNCNANIYLDELSYYIGCTSSTHATTFLNQSSSFDLVIRGRGLSRNCVLIQASSRGTTLRVECSQGMLCNPTSVTTSTTTTTKTTITVTSSTGTTFQPTTPSLTTTTVEQTTVDKVTDIDNSTRTPKISAGTTFQPTTTSLTTSSTGTTALPTTPSLTTTTVERTTVDKVTDIDNSTSTTKISAATASTTAEVITTTSEKTTAKSTTLADTTSTSQKTSDTTPFTSQSASESSSETTSSLSTTAAGNETTTDKEKDKGADTFPATELIVGLTVGIVAVLILIAVCLCYRERHRNENVEKKQILSVSPVTEGEMREIETVTVDNPMYFYGDDVSTFPQSAPQPSQPVKQTNGVTSPEDISEMYASVNKQKRSGDAILY